MKKYEYQEIHGNIYGMNELGKVGWKFAFMIETTYYQDGKIQSSYRSYKVVMEREVVDESAK